MTALRHFTSGPAWGFQVDRAARPLRLRRMGFRRAAVVGVRAGKSRLLAGTWPLAWTC